MPSKAFNLYKDAFKRQDENRFEAFLESVEEGTDSVKAWAIFPVDIYKSRGWDRKATVAQWNALPDYMNDENILPVCDVSDSMKWTSLPTQPMDVSVSLWVYLSERSKWIFKDAFITFSDTPKLQYLKWDCIDRFDQLIRSAWGWSTDLQRVFELILTTAVRDNLPESEMPTKVMIISDMEFNYCGRNTNLDEIKIQFEKAWYKIPWVIFWNVYWRIGNVPAQEDNTNVWLVSGYSPAIVRSVLWWEDFTPKGVMLKALEKYEFIDEVV